MKNGAGLRRLRLSQLNEYVIAALVYPILSAIFLWVPISSGTAFLPTDLAFRYDYVWKYRESEPALVVAQNGLLSDVSNYYFPYAAYAIDRLRGGHFPLWNPYILTGTPFFASDQAAVLDPINLLTYTAGPIDYWLWGAWLRLSVIGLTTYGFVRALGRSKAGAMLSGIIFAFCGFVAVWLNYGVVTSVAWLPALFWATTGLMKSGRLSFMAAAGLAMGFLLLGGHPETQFLCGLLWGLFAIYSLYALRTWRAQFVTGRYVLLLFGSAILGLAVSAVQNVPFAALLLTSNGFASRTMSVHPFEPVNSLLYAAVLFFPNFSGNDLERNFWFRPFTNFNEQTGYVGLVAVGLALVGALFWFRRDKVAPFFAIGTLLAVLFAVRAPGFHLIKALPLFNVGHGVRWAIPISFFSAVLAAYGVDAIVSMGAGSRRLRGITFGFAQGTIAAFIIPLGVFFGLRASGVGSTASLDLPVRTITRLFAPLHFTLYWPAIFLFCATVLLYFAWRGLLSGRSLAVLLTCAAFADLWTFGSTYNPSTPQALVYPQTKIVSRLQADIGHDRVAGISGALRPNAGMYFGLRDLRGYEDIVEERFSGFYDRLYRPGSTVLDITLNPTADFAVFDKRQFDIAAVRYFLSVRKPRVQLDPKYFSSVLEEGGLALYENRDALPRAYVVYNAQVRPNVDAQARSTRSVRHNPRSAVILDAGTPIISESGINFQSSPVRWVRDEPEEIEMEATLPERGVLVLSDEYAPGWEATVDGTPAPIRRAHVVFRGVELPPGKHLVRFTYRPVAFYYSAVVSLAAVLVILAIAVVHLAGRKAFR